MRARLKVKLPMSALAEFAIVKLIEEYEENPDQLMLDLSR
jgi:hypothetical protein